MRRPRIRLGERVTFKPGVEENDQRRTGCRGGDGDHGGGSRREGTDRVAHNLHPSPITREPYIRARLRFKRRTPCGCG